MEFHWLWTPGLNPATSLPDLSLFPRPPMFVLGDGFVSMSRTLEYGTLGTGLSVTGTVNDGFGGVWSFSGALHEVLPPAGTPPGRGILTPVVIDATHISVSMSPSVKIDTLGTLPGDTSAELASASSVPHLITLSSPAPFARPDLGDGNGQWIYDDVQPGPGRLRVPGHVLVERASSDDTAWMASKNIVDVSISPEPPNAMLHYWTSFLDTLSPNTLNTPSEEGDFVYNGLPYSNSDFGDHVATLQVNSQNSQQAHLQTFFTAVNLLGQTISNYPSTDGVTANWYHYYNQVINPDADPPETYDPTISAPYAAFCRTTWELDSNSPWGYDVEANNIHMGSGAINSTVLPVFALRTKGDGKQWMTYIGELHIAGIHSYLRTYLEEATHADQIKNLIVLPPKNSAGQIPPTPDRDGDGVPDADERKYGLDPDNPDSTGYYQYYARLGYPGDSEALASIIVLGKLLAQKGIWNRDWANTGLQHGSRPPYRCDTSRNIFPWYYHSLETGADTADIPADAHALTQLPNLTN